MKRVRIEFSSNDYANMFVEEFGKDEEYMMICTNIGSNENFVTIRVREGYEDDALPTIWSCIYNVGIDYGVLNVKGE